MKEAAVRAAHGESLSAYTLLALPVRHKIHYTAVFHHKMVAKTE